MLKAANASATSHFSMRSARATNTNNHTASSSRLRSRFDAGDSLAASFSSSIRGEGDERGAGQTGSAATSEAIDQASVDLEQLLGGLHEWRDVQAVIRTTFQALYDVAHAQNNTVREVESRLTEVQEDLEANINHRASSAELQTVLTVIGELRGTSDSLSRRIEEEAQGSQEAQRAAAEETQALRSGLSDLRSALERHRVEVQQWRAGLEAGLGRLASECATSSRTVQAECLSALQQETERLDGALSDQAAVAREEASRLESALGDRTADIQALVYDRAHRWDEELASCRQYINSELDRFEKECDSRMASLEASLRQEQETADSRAEELTNQLESSGAALERRCRELMSEMQGSMTKLVKDTEDRSARQRSAHQELTRTIQEKLKDSAEKLSAAISEKASPQQLREIVREAWSREESQVARLQRLCESKVSSSEFAALTSLAEGKASMADVEAVSARHVQKRISAMIADHQLLSRSEVQTLMETTTSECKNQIRSCERRADELARAQQRTAATTSELRSELRVLEAGKLDRGEVESMVAGALTDWVRAAQRGADAVQAAMEAASRTVAGGCSPPQAAAPTPTSDGAHSGQPGAAWLSNPLEAAHLPHPPSSLQQQQKHQQPQLQKAEGSRSQSLSPPSGSFAAGPQDRGTMAFQMQQQQQQQQQHQQQQQPQSQLLDTFDFSTPSPQPFVDRGTNGRRPLRRSSSGSTGSLRPASALRRTSPAARGTGVPSAPGAFAGSVQARSNLRR